MWKGSAYYYCIGKTWKLKEGDYFIVPPETEHVIYIQNSENSKIYTLDFNLDVICENEENVDVTKKLNYKYIDYLYHKDIGIINNHSISPDLKLQVEEILQNIMDDCRNNSKRYLILRSRFLTLLAFLSLDIHKIHGIGNAKKGENSSIEKVRDSIKFIDQQFSTNFDFLLLCKMTGLSPAYYRRLFKQITNNTFVQYLIDLKINKAKTLLITTDMSPRQISDGCGFNNVSHYYKTFRKQIGLSPQEFKKIKTKSVL